MRRNWGIRCRIQYHVFCRTLLTVTLRIFFPNGNEHSRRNEQSSFECLTFFTQLLRDTSILDIGYRTVYLYTQQRCFTQLSFLVRIRYFNETSFFHFLRSRLGDVYFYNSVTSTWSLLQNCDSIPGSSPDWLSRLADERSPTRSVSISRRLLMVGYWEFVHWGKWTYFVEVLVYIQIGLRGGWSKVISFVYPDSHYIKYFSVGTSVRIQVNI